MLVPGPPLLPLLGAAFTASVLQGSFLKPISLFWVPVGEDAEEQVRLLLRLSFLRTRRVASFV